MTDFGIEKWPLCMAEAKKFVAELKLEYYSDPKHLTFVEALYILRTKLKLGPGIPPTIFRPWKITNHPSQEKINSLLQRSLQVQMGRIENTEFSQFILSNACLAVSGFLYVYLKHLGIPSEIVTGVFCFSTKENSDGTPHVWLEIGGRPIENTYVHMDEKQQNVSFEIKAEELYSKENLNTTSRKLFFGQDNFSEPRVSGPNSLKVFTMFGQSCNVEKYLVASLKIAAINPCIKMFDVVMKDYIRRDFGIVVQDLEKKWDSQCWRCQSTDQPEKLKTCAGCKMSKYCGQICQKEDWSLHKILHKEINHYAASTSIS